ncbi:hypothetical protein EJD97_022144, partial [Solanum chilense]
PFSYVYTYSYTCRWFLVVDRLHRSYIDLIVYDTWKTIVILYKEDLNIIWIWIEFLIVMKFMTISVRH